MRSVALVLLVATLAILVLMPKAAVAFDVPEECSGVTISGICYGKVPVRNMYWGARAEHPVLIHNGRDTEAVYDLLYKYPDAVEWGFEEPPVEAREWVTVGDEQPGAVETISIPPHQWASVLIALELPASKPKGVTIPKRWEFRIKIMERQTGMIVEAYEQRWLIEMAPPGFSLAIVIGAATGALVAGAGIGAYMMRRRAHR